MSMCLTLGVPLLDSTTETKIVLSYQFTAGELVWSARSSMYLQITLVFLTALYMNLIYLSFN